MKRIGESIRRLRWKLANRLSTWAIRLRGERVYHTDCRAIGNKASALKDRIWLNVVSVSANQLDALQKERMDEIEADLEAMAQLARETWRYEMGDENKPPLEPEWFIRLADQDKTS